MKVVTVFLFLLATAVGIAQNTSGIKGTVLDLEMQNEPLLFASVEIKGARLETTTNLHGNFEFNTLKSGTYTVRISYPGYENIELPIQVKPNEITQVNLGMAAKQIDFSDVAGLAPFSEAKETVASSKATPKK